MEARRYTNRDGIECITLPVVGLGEHMENFQKIAATPIESRDIPTIKAWRAERCAAGLPSGLRDFYDVNGFCFHCNGTGWKSLSVNCYSYRQCPECRGTGKGVQG